MNEIGGIQDDWRPLPASPWIRAAVTGCAVVRRTMTILALATLVILILISTVSREQPWGAGSETSDRAPVDRPSVHDTLPKPSDGCREQQPDDDFVGVLQVVMFDGSITKMAFDEVWKRSHSTMGHDDVWVIGVCPDAAPLDMSTGRLRGRF